MLGIAQVFLGRSPARYTFNHRQDVLIAKNGNPAVKVTQVSEKVEDWKAITPETLLVPVEHIRKTFDEGVWKCSRVTEQLCFAELHPDDPQVDLGAFRSAFVTYRSIIGPQSARQFDSYHQTGTPAAIFHAYLEAFSAGLDSNILGSFDDLLKIGIAHSAKLSTRPVEWAKTHLKYPD
jgi:hypothetical protein